MRRAVPALVALLAAGLVASTSGAGSVPDPFVFPVVGPYRYTNDFGDPRPQGRHEGNDVLAPKKSTVVAVEDGKIKFWTTSARAGCMLYLYGVSGTMYLYIHLNNDVTMANDNRGKCVPGGSYWPGLKDSQKVVAGQAIGYVGDSGDADGTPQLHFEVHPNDGPPGSAVTLSLKGRVLLASAMTLKMKVDAATVFPVGITLLDLRKPMVLSITKTALVGPASLRAGKTAIVLTQPAKTSLETQAAEDGAFSVARIVAG
jgi:murein DD-endopeptidase MepM/ murein hydrolase activator NlpD